MGFSYFENCIPRSHSSYIQMICTSIPAAFADGQCLPADSMSYVLGMSAENGWKKCLQLDTLKAAIFSAQYSPQMLFLPCSQQILPHE